MNNLKTYITTIVLIFCIISCSAQTSLTMLSFKEGKTTTIKNVVDMKGEELVLPKNVTLKFKKGGSLKNGSVKADNTSIVGYKQGIFDDVKIGGEWNVKYIRTDMFKNLSQLNSLQNVFALASEKTDNVILIEEGTYKVAAKRNGETILSVHSNTEVIINGSITMQPNGFTNYYIVGLKGENIQLHGKGTIVGDKHTHIRTTGEWGMGVNLARCKNVDICDLTIRDCWGDCIYIGTHSQNVLVEKCHLVHGRRQGISVTSGNKIILRDLKITNVGGTSPEYGIDIEPNKDELVNDVLIDNVTIDKCRGGILVYGKAKGAIVGNVTIKNCNISNTSKLPISVKKCESVKISGCTLANITYKQPIYCEDVGIVIKKNNMIK